MLNKRLFATIVQEVFEDQVIKKVSKNGSGKEKDFTFDFKGISLQKDFLKDFSLRQA